MGRRVTGLLEYIHSWEGLAFFSVLPDRTDEEIVGAWNECFPLIASLPREMQHFVFRSSLIADLENRRAPLDSERIRSEPENSLAGIPLRLDWFLDVANLAAEAALDRYLCEHHPQGKLAGLRRAHPSAPTPAEPAAGSSVLLERIESMLADGIDSLKAGQMETLRQIDHITRQPEEYQAILEDLIGTTLFHRLDEETKRALCHAEHHYRSSRRPDGVNPAILEYSRGVENELKVLLGYLEASLKRGRSEFPPGDRNPLLKRGKLNEKLSLGDVVRFIRGERLVRQTLQKYGFKPEAIAAALAEVSEIRNRAAHPVREKPCTSRDVERLRDLILRPNGVLSLFRRQRESSNQPSGGQSPERGY